ncbi:hypothetical protein HK100_005074, partial [Physocladia obscura]
MAKKSRLGLMNFAMFFLQHISEQISRAPLSFNGFFFSHCVETHTIFPTLQTSLSTLFSALRKSWNISDVPVVIMMDEYGFSTWNELRDQINGIIMTNALLERDGSLKIRSNSARFDFDKQMKLLKNEISLREDFIVLGIEIVEGNLSHQLHAHIIKFYNSFGFKFWVTKSPTLSLIEDIVPNKLLTVGSDMLEIAMAPAVLRCLKLVEETYVSLIESGDDGQDLQATDWNYILNNLRMSSKFWTTHQLLFINLRKHDFLGAHYVKIQFPNAPVVFSWLDQQTAAEITNMQEKISKVVALSLKKPSHGSDSVSIQHKYFGIAINPARQERLGNLVLKVLKDLMQKNLLSAARYNNDLGDDTENFSASFVSMLSFFDAMTDPIASTPAAKWVLSLFDRETREIAIKGIRMLSLGLRNNNISVWSAAKVAFIPKEGVDDILYDTIWALTDEIDGNLVIFLSDGHPKMEEAILHSFMKHAFGWRTGLCIMMEALVSAQMNKEESFTMPVPFRIIHEIKSSSCSKMLTYVRNADDVVKTVTNIAKTPGEKNYLVGLSKFINECANYLLIVQEQFTDLMKFRINEEYKPQSLPEDTLVNYMGEQTLSSEGLNNVVQMFAGIEKLLVVTPGSRNCSMALCFLAFTMYKACRRCAYLELKLAVTDSSTQILPDKDQVAVCLEMATTQTTLQTIFCLSSLQLAPFFHKVQRKLLRDAKIEENEKEEIEHVKEFSIKNLDFSMGRQIGNGYIYIYPILVDMSLNAALGSGLYFSDRMDSETLQAATIAFL